MPDKSTNEGQWNVVRRRVRGLVVCERQGGGLIGPHNEESQEDVVRYVRFLRVPDVAQAAAVGAAASPPPFPLPGRAHNEETVSMVRGLSLLRPLTETD